MDEPDYLIEGGWVMGAVSTNTNGSRCLFPICEVAEWENATPDWRNKLLIEAANASGMFEIYVPRP